MKSFPVRSLVTPGMLLYIVILFFVEIVRGAAVISFMPIYGEKALGLSLDVIGAAITAHYVTDTVVKLAIGYLMDRFAVRTLVNVGLLFSLAGVALLYNAHVPWLFITAAALYGIGISPIWIVCLTKVRDDKRATQMGFLYTIWLVGLGAGPVLCNLLLNVDMKMTYWALLATALGCWLLSFFLAADEHAHIDRIPFNRQLAILGDRLREMKTLMPGMVLQTLGAGMLLPILPSFAVNNLGMTSNQYSLLLVLGGGATVLGLIPMGRLSDHLGKKWFLVIGFVLFGLVLFALTLGPSIKLALLFAFVLGLSYAAVLPAWNALLAAYVPPGQQGLGWGVFSTVEGVGGMIGPYVGGVLATALSQSHVVGLAGLLFMIISIFYVFFPFRLFRGES